MYLACTKIIALIYMKKEAVRLHVNSDKAANMLTNYTVSNIHASIAIFGWLTTLLVACETPGTTFMSTDLKCF